MQRPSGAEIAGWLETELKRPVLKAIVADMKERRESLIVSALRIGDTDTAKARVQALTWVIDLFENYQIADTETETGWRPDTETETAED